MKLIIKEYLSSLKERDELDALLPDLLSQMGLKVFSKPGRGTRQYGVDIAAVGKLDSGTKKVYLLSVKSGDLGRKDWNSGSLQDLQPSLDEILTVYIPTHLPSEYKNLPIEICICIAGDIQETVRLNITQYEKSKKTNLLEIVEWNGDYLSYLIEKYFLQDALLPKGLRPQLRKSLALLDEPQASFIHFSKLINSLSAIDVKKNKARLTVLRQMNVCLWILFAWARDIGNLESAYLSAELTMLHAWELNKNHIKKSSKIANSICLTFNTILFTYMQITGEYLAKSIIPYASKLHGLSSAVRTHEKLDVNLKLFDVLGRLSIAGIWTHWNRGVNLNNINEKNICNDQMKLISDTLKKLIVNNPSLYLPIKDEQVIDISLALLFFSLHDGNEKDCVTWLTEMTHQAIFSFKSNGLYPCINNDYSELLEHPKRNDSDYKQNATAASVLYPTIGLWAALLNDNNLYCMIQETHKNYLSHSNYQFWYPDGTSEENIYVNKKQHGATYSHVPINLPSSDFLSTIQDECKKTGYFNKLSCIDNGMFPLLLVACRHYRLPIPIDFTLAL